MLITYLVTTIIIGVSLPFLVYVFLGIISIGPYPYSAISVPSWFLWIVYGILLIGIVHLLLTIFYCYKLSKITLHHKIMMIGKFLLSNVVCVNVILGMLVLILPVFKFTQPQFLLGVYPLDSFTWTVLVSVIVSIIVSLSVLKKIK